MTCRVAYHQGMVRHFLGDHRAGTDALGATGSGLGLAIVEGAMLRMGGGFSLSLADHGGLCASLRLRRA